MIGTLSGDDLIIIVKARYPDLESLAERLNGRRGLYGLLAGVFCPLTSSGVDF